MHEYPCTSMLIAISESKNARFYRYEANFVSLILLLVSSNNKQYKIIPVAQLIVGTYSI